MASHGTGNKRALELRDLTKSYGGDSAPAVSDLTLDVEEGEFVSLLGPSGCGKTTTLRIVAGLLDSTSGAVHVDGSDFTHVPVHKRGMGMVFQSYALFPHLTVEQNIAFGLEMRRTPKSERRSRVQEALDLVELGHLGSRKIAALSGGQQQRIALARALVVEPRLLLLDEPLSNLDAKLRQTMRDEISGIQRRLGITTLFVTHDQDEALYMSDRIAVMNGGRLEQYGSPREVYEEPRNEFVASFIGRANLVEVTVTGRTPGQERPVYEFDSELVGPGRSIGPDNLARGRHVLVVRPHRIQVSPASPGHPRQADVEVSARVVNTGYTGDSLSIEAMSDGKPFYVELPTRSDVDFSVDDTVLLSWSREQSYLMPPEDAIP